MPDKNNTKIALSIAIVTRNRPDSLKRTLESLFKQAGKPFEIIISDDSDLPHLIELNKSLANKFSCKYLTGPQRGLYANRNFVAKNCSGTHIRTMDDDHEFPEHHIEICLGAVKQDISAIWTIGEYFPTDKAMPLPAPIPGQLHPRGYSYAPGDMKNYFGISCGATIYPRRVIDANVLNIELFKFGILYLEYGIRLFNKGFIIKHLPDTYVIHHFDENNRSVSSKEIQYSAQMFSMLMFSFYHKKSLKNRLLTVAEIIKGIIRKKYSPRLVYTVYRLYKQEHARY